MLQLILEIMPITYVQSLPSSVFSTARLCLEDAWDGPEPHEVCTIFKPTEYPAVPMVSEEC